MRKKMFLMTFVLMLGLVSSASAVTIIWTNAGVGNDWTNPANWDLGVPTAADNATFEPGPTGAFINLGDAVVASRVALGHNNAGVASQLTMNDGSLAVTKEFYIGGDSSSQLNVTGIFNLHGGTVTVGPGSDKFFVGYYGTGVLYMTGGSVTAPRVYIAGEKANSTGTVVMMGGTINATSRLRVGDKAGSAGYLYMYDGVINAPTVQIALADAASIGEMHLYGGLIKTDSFSMGAQGTLDIELGNLLIAGNQTASIQAYIDSGQITAFNGVGIVSNAYHAGWDKTIVSGCLPEPATMSLLGLGGLLLLRRRK